MAAIVVANDIATYLQTMNAGTLGVDIFYDTQPNEPDNCITVYDAGGQPPQAPPEAWRELYIQVRSKVHAIGYEKIWCVLNYILEPDVGYMAVGSCQYIAQLQAIPSIFSRDNEGRYLFSFRVTVCNIAGSAIVDPWLECLANWTATLLGSSWNVYKGWKGNKRPAIAWMLSGLQIAERGRASYWVKKQFTGLVLARTPNEHAAAVTTIIERLSDSIKIPFDTVNKKYLTVIAPAGKSTSQDFVLNQVSVTLQRVTSRPKDEVTPFIEVVSSTGTITE